MNTITATLEADADGTLHLPLPPELRQGKLKVTATVEPLAATVTEGAEAQRQQNILEIMTRIRARNPFRTIVDPGAWQREMRVDRPLPGRD